MSDTTKIQWATSTGNPWIGCTKVSPGCAHCYAAELDANRFSRTMGGGTKEKPISHWGKGAPRFRTKGFWKDAVRWNKEAARRETIHEANGQSYNPPRIFPSLCDWLDEEVPIEWFADFLKLIHDTPNLDWLLLTKRPESFSRRLFAAILKLPGVDYQNWAASWQAGDVVPENVWIGTSVEDQERAEERIPALLNIPARIRFLSAEPLLGPVNLDCVHYSPNISEEEMQGMVTIPTCLERIDWVIVGGESGPHARACNVEWIRSLVTQCKAAGVACFVKQLGAVVETDNNWLGGSCLEEIDTGKLGPARWRKPLKDKKGGDMAEWPEDLRVREFPR